MVPVSFAFLTNLFTAQYNKESPLIHIGMLRESNLSVCILRG